MRVLGKAPLKCPVCGSTDIVLNEETEEYVCTNCGYVFSTEEFSYYEPAPFSGDSKGLSAKIYRKVPVLMRGGREIDVKLNLVSEVLTWSERLAVSELKEYEKKEIERIAEALADKLLQIVIPSKQTRYKWGCILAKMILDELAIPRTDEKCFSRPIPYLETANRALYEVLKKTAPKNFVSESLLSYLSFSDRLKYTVLKAFDTCIAGFAKNMTRNGSSKTFGKYLSLVSPFDALYKFWHNVNFSSERVRRLVSCVQRSQTYEYYFLISYLRGAVSGHGRRKDAKTGLLVKVPAELAEIKRVQVYFSRDGSRKHLDYNIWLGLQSVQPGFRPLILTLKQTKSLKNLIFVNGEDITEKNRTAVPSRIDKGAVAFLDPEASKASFKTVATLRESAELLYSAGLAVSIKLFCHVAERFPFEGIFDFCDLVELAEPLNQHVERMAENATKNKQFFVQVAKTYGETTRKRYKKY